ncbi:MAG: hypothetical protein EOP88_17155 [Verrucomicrobiaceae bacterium]|nr:MAG: hypothetical protein EOP88_17155 [Verrucomicrobiaceae bacterium]
MTPETERRIACTMIAIRALRQHGVIPCDAPASPGFMSFVSVEIGEPVSKATFRRVQQRGLAAARLALRAHLTTQPPQEN